MLAALRNDSLACKALPLQFVTFVLVNLLLIQSEAGTAECPASGAGRRGECSAGQEPGAELTKFAAASPQKQRQDDLYED